jgi:succinate dehydrogenase / fumarate reductase flavoprotein subunit
MWDHCGMGRNEADLKKGLQRIPELREQFWAGVLVPGAGESLNQALENANRVSDFFELAELMCLDALRRDESCGAHFREEHQTPDGEAQRDDERFCNVSVWEHAGAGNPPRLNVEPLTFEYVKPAQRSYK